MLLRADAPGRPRLGRWWSAPRRRASRCRATGEGWIVPQGILAMVVGSLSVYAALFGIGYWIYGRYVTSLALTAIAIVGAVYLVRVWSRVSGSEEEDEPTPEPIPLVKT